MSRRSRYRSVALSRSATSRVTRNSFATVLIRWSFRDRAQARRRPGLLAGRGIELRIEIGVLADRPQGLSYSARPPELCQVDDPKGREVGREALRHHLEQGLVLREPGQWMPAEASETDARGHGALHGPLGLVGDEDLAAVSGRADPRDRVHRQAH